MSTQTSPIKTTREDRRVVTIPEARPPRRWGLIVAVALLVVAALILGVIVGSISQRAVIRERVSQVAAAQEAARLAAAQSDQALAQAAIATALVDGLRTNLGTTKQALAILRARGHESGALVRDLHARLASIRVRLVEARREGARLTGPPLPEGRYAVHLAAVGASGSPPLVVFDLGTWLRGRAARQAAIADGVIGSNGRLPHHRYFRNHTLALRVMRVAPDARVSVVNPHGHPVYDSSLIRLQHLLLGQSSRASRVQRDPFWIVVRGGSVVSIHRQAYP